MSVVATVKNPYACVEEPSVSMLSSAASNTRAEDHGPLEANDGLNTCGPAVSELQNVPTDRSECGDNTPHGPPIPDPGENDTANHCVQSSDRSAIVVVVSLRPHSTPHPPNFRNLVL